MPLFKTKMMPVRAARSGMRGLPPLGLGSSFGSSGSIASHNSSVTNRFPMLGSIAPSSYGIGVLQGALNVWHSFQYLAVVLYLNRVRAERGLIGSGYVARVSRSGKSLYWMCFLFTVGAALAYLLVHGALILAGVWASDPEQQHYFSFYTVVLSALLIHYYFDHFLFLQVDDVITPRWN